MAEPNRVPVPVRFGLFEVSPDSGELRKNGALLKLSGQAIQVLRTLLERPGQIVTREELQQRLWPGASFGDFEHGLNAAVNRLREVLGDSATEPRLIETVPRRGYRFIGTLDSHEVPLTVEPEKIPPTKKQNWRIGVMLFLIIVSLALAIFLWRTRQSSRPIKIVPFTSLPGFEGAPSFSPDGTQIVFAAAETWTDPDKFNPQIYVKAIGDEKVVRLTESPAFASAPQWSPNGTTIAYRGMIKTGYQEYEYAIFLMTPLGGAKRKLHEVSEKWDGITSWSADSQVLAYADKPVGQRSGVFLIPISGSPVRRITTAPEGMFDGNPAFSPDGSQIAFVRNTDDGGKSVILVISASGGEPREVTSLHRIGRLAWTADGKRIIFPTGYVGESSLYSVSSRGGEPERIQFVSSSAFDPAISAKGDKLAYASPIFDTNIWRVPLEGSLPPTKLVGSTRLDMQANFSPDGSKLAFASNRDGHIAVWICNADGTDPVHFSRGRGATAEWSPDGKYIVFDTDEYGRWTIMVARSDGTREDQLGANGFDRRAPSWSADGKWFYFTSNRSGRWEIWKASYPGNEAVQVTHNGGGYAQESRDGKFVYYQKMRTNNANVSDFLLPEIWRLPRNGGPEELVFSVSERTSSDPTLSTWFWRVVQEGIYFVDNSAQPRPLLKFYGFSTRKVRTIRQLEKMAWGAPGIGVSPDRKSVLITQIDDVGSDLMLLENFR
jgi:Tol biopolymer transport system component/DNA-binding winged helix-turn-helix (wHTH) protein